MTEHTEPGGIRRPSAVRRYTELEPERWRNDGGWTRRVWASSRPDPLWRLSLANIDQPGLFSTFPQVDRILVMASETVLTLDIDDTVHTLALGQAVSFPGEAAVNADIETGGTPAVVVNVMVQRGEPVGVVVVPRHGPVSLNPTLAAVTLLSGRAVLFDGSELGPWDSFLPGSDCPAPTFYDAITVEIHITTPAADHEQRVPSINTVHHQETPRVD